MRKRIAFLFALTLVLVGASLVEVKGSVVHAEEVAPYIDANKDFIAEYITFTGDKVAPEATTVGYEDWLFAGWYSDSTCTDESAIKDKSSVEAGAAWAKYVPADLLTVKVQVKKDVQSSSNTNMRLVSSVDTLNYANVGFMVDYYGITKNVSMQTVYGHIVASEESGVDYEYNPKVVDTKSTWFATATLLNINSKNYDNVFVIKPYWETFDGTVVYGQSRHVKVSDSYSNLVNVPIKVGESTSLSELTVDGENPEEVRYCEGEKYATLMVKVNSRAGLPSLTKYTVSDGQTAVYRNLQTKYTGTNTDDITWYMTVSEEDEFVIATAADLYGFATIVDSDDKDIVASFGATGTHPFKGKTVYLGADIVVNENVPTTYTEWTEYLASNTPAYSWEPIGNSYSKNAAGQGYHRFAGTFDGMGETISGIYFKDTASSSNADTEYAGLFAYVQNGTGHISNFGLEDSYFECTSTGGWVTGGNTYALLGSVVGQLGGSMKNIYSNAVVVSAGAHVGGLVGRAQCGGANYVSTVDSCWFNGEIVVNRGTTLNHECVGGIVGNLVQYYLDITDCLMTGKINFTYTTLGAETYDLGIGGILGANNSKGNGDFTASNCLSLGTITVQNSAGTVDIENLGVGSMVGTNRRKVTSSDSYITEGLEAVGLHTTESYAQTQTGKPQVVTTFNLTGESAYINTDLDFYSVDNEDGVWAVVSGGTPVLKNWYKGEIENDFSDFNRINTSWYDNGFSYKWKGTTVEDVTAYSWTETIGSTFAIEKASDLWGLAKLVNNGTYLFKDKTVKMNKDIIINEGNAEEWAEGKNRPIYSWDEIGISTSRVFQGSFDGDNHTISGLYMSSGDSTVMGLFGYAGYGTIKNFRLENSFLECTKVNAIANMGSIVGSAYNTTTTLENIYSDAILHSTGRRVGGLVAIARKAVIMKNCWFDGVMDIDYTVNGALGIGGLIGYHYGGVALIDTCLYTGSLTLDYTNSTNQSTAGLYIGAIAGQDTETAGANLCIQNCLSAGEMNINWHKNSDLTTKPDSLTYIGSVAGRAINSASTTKNVYSIVDINTWIEGKGTGKITSAGNTSNGAVNTASTFLDETYEDYLFGIGAQTWTDLAFTAEDRATANATTKETLTGYWAAREGKLPIPATLAQKGEALSVSNVATLSGAGTKENPYVISSAAEFCEFSQLALTNKFTGKYIVLNADIDIQDMRPEGSETVFGWLPIGHSLTSAGRFEGYFDGKGHTIKGVHVESPENYVGLFGYTLSGSSVGNFNLVDSSFVGTSSDAYVGSVVSNMCGTIHDVYSEATIESVGVQSGGLVARANGNETEDTSLKTTETIEDSKVTDDNGNTTITKTTTVTRTYVRGTVEIKDCWFNGTINVTAVNGTPYYGGIVGVHVQGNTNISNCLFTGNINVPETSKTLYVGGIVGSMMAQSTQTTTSETEEPSTTTDEETGLTTTTTTTNVTVKIWKDENGNNGYSKCNLSSSISAGEITSPNGNVAAIIGLLMNKIANDGLPVNTYLTLDSVFATRDCHSNVLNVQSDSTNDSFPGVTSNSVLTGKAIQTHNWDRLIGYCTEEDASAKLDYENDWSMRLSGVPVPKALVNIVGIVADGALVEGTIVDVSTLDAELGLGSFSKTLANAVHKGNGNYVIACEGIEKTTYEAYLATLVANGFEEYANNGVESDVYGSTYTKEVGDWVLNLSYEEGSQILNISICTTGFNK